MANQSYLVDFNQGVTGDTGQDNVDAIQPVSDGEPATSTVFRRPSENLRARTELVRDFSRDMAYYRDFNHLGLWGTGTFTWGGSFDLGGTGLIGSSVGAQVEVRPILTPGSNTKGQLVVGTSPNTVTYDVTATAYITQGMDLITVEHIDSAGAALTVSITPGPVKRIVVLFDSTNLAHNVAAVAGAVNGAITADVELTGKLTATPGAGTGVTVVQLETPILGTADEEAHIIQASDIAALGPLNDGDAVAVRYAYVVEEPVSGTPGGRWEANPARGTAAIPGASLFVTTNNPEYIPGALPLFKVQNDTLIWFNGARFERGVTVSITGLSAATVPVDDTVFSGTDTLVVNGGIDNPLSPTATVQTALESVDARLTVRRSVTFTVTDGVASTGGAFNNIQDAITALSGSGGHIYVRRGTYTLPAAYTIPAQIHLEGEDSSLVSITSSTAVDISSNCRIEKVSFTLGINDLRVVGSDTQLESVTATNKIQVDGDNCALISVTANAASAPSLQLVGNFNTVVTSNTDGKIARTLPVTTYVVGDGVTTFGDFNGSTGLNDCLDYIAALPAADRPERAEIVVHGGVTQTINGSKTINSGATKDITLVISAGTVLTAGGITGRPLVQFDGATIGANTFGLAVTAPVTRNVSLVLNNLDVRWTGTTAAGRGIFGCTGYIETHNTYISYSATPAVDAGFTIYSEQAHYCLIDTSIVEGRICLFSDPGDGSVIQNVRGGLISNSRLLNTQIVLRNPSGPSVPGKDVVSGITLSNCYIAGRTGAPYTGSISLIDARATKRLTVLGCRVSYGLNENALDGRTYNSENPASWSIRDTLFETGTVNGTHTAGSGINGAEGTGWAINVLNGSYINVDNCTIQVDSIDAGALKLKDTAYCSVNNSSITGAHGASVGDTITAVYVTATTAGFETDSVFNGNKIGPWSGLMPRSRGFVLENTDGVVVDNNTLNGKDLSGTEITGRTNSNSALYVYACNDVRISNNKFKRWNYGDTTSACVYFASSFPLASNRITVSNNVLEGNGNYAIDWNATADKGPTITSNCIAGEGTSNNLGIHIFNLGAGSHWSIIGNTFRHNSGPGFDFIFFDLSGGGVCSGNASNADIRRTGATTVRGYRPDDSFFGYNQDLNAVNNYT